MLWCHEDFWGFDFGFGLVRMALGNVVVLQGAQDDFGQDELDQAEFVPAIVPARARDDRL
jgi:hypothetical protein